MAESFEVVFPVAFAATALLLALLERLPALQRAPVRIDKRWTSNIGLFLLGSAITTAIVPTGIYVFALHQPPGPMSRWGFPLVLQIAVTFLLLDLWRYWEHRVYHFVPLLWRLHLVHHSDTHVDVTTSERHHPLDMLLGTAVLMALIAALGFPAPAVGIYLLTATIVALYSHANLRLPAGADRILSRLIVTAPVHAVHHSDQQAQTDSNFGSVLTAWDRLFGTYVDPQRARIAHFGLHYFHLPADTGLARVLLQPFAFRRNLDYPERRDEAADRRMAAAIEQPPATAMTPGCKDAILGGVAGCALVCLVMWPTLVEMTRTWNDSEAYQYAWLVLPMLVYVLVGRHGPAAMPVDPQPGFTGIPVVIAAAACWGAATLMNIDVGRQFALVLAIQGVAMAALGWRAYRRLFPAFALLFLMIPSGDLLQPALRVLTVKAIELLAIVANLPHSVEGFVIYIGTHRYIVVDECSGLAYVTLATFLGYCFGLMLYRSFARIVALALFGAALGVLSNILRVDSIVLIDWLRDSQMDLGAHGVLQWIALLATLGLLFYVLDRLRGESPLPAAATPNAAEPSTRARKFAPVLAGLSGLLIAGGAAALPANDTRPSQRMLAEAFPRTLSGWALADAPAAWVVDPQGRTESIDLTYRRNGRDLHVVIVETRSPDAKLPPWRFMPNDHTVWREKQVRHESGCVAAGCIALVHTTWQRDRGHELRDAYYAYSVGRHATDSTFAVRAAHGWHRLIGRRDHPRMIGFVSADGPADTDEIAAAFLALQAAL